METAFVGPDRAGPGLAMPRAKMGRALNSIRACGPGRAVRSTGRADKIRPVQISGLNSFHPARFKQTSQSARPDLTRCIRVQYCFNFISAGNSDLDIAQVEPRKSIDQTALTNYITQLTRLVGWVRIGYGY